MKSDVANRRSDNIRKRRLIETRKTSTRSERGKRRSNQIATPPVMGRARKAGSLNQVMSQRSTKFKHKTRRRYDFSLNAQGVEMRLPSIPRVSFGWRLVSIALTVFLLFVLYEFWESPKYSVDAAEISGLNLISSAEINSVLGITGEHIFSINAAELENEIAETFPEFSSLSVQVKLPNSVLVTVTERIPVLVWSQEGRSELVDANGVTFPVRGGIPKSQYPVIEALSDPPISSNLEANDQEKENYPDLIALTEEISLGAPVSGVAKTLLSPEMVTAILYLSDHSTRGAKLVYDPVHGLGWKDRRNRDVYFGDIDNIEMKFLVYQTILNDLKTKEITPVSISVEYVYAPYYRLEP